jgi:hypothetical protein
MLTVRESRHVVSAEQKGAIVSEHMFCVQVLHIGARLTTPQTSLIVVTNCI